jgi:Lrp/AsnC family transcriptional regulator, leucine-responsive regulatory protein
VQNISKHCMDELDRSILLALQHDARLSNVRLAKQVGLSESACLRRVKTLEDSGLVDKAVLLLNQNTLGFSGTVFVQVTLKEQQQQTLKSFEDAVVTIEQIMECYLLSGDADYMLRVIYKDNEDYKKIHLKLTNLPGVQRVHSSFALSTVIKKTALPLLL